MVSYLPEEWQDDIKMSGLMSVMKDRAVNKVDYDRKLRFWTDTIYASCVGEKNAVFDLLVLKRRFRRKDKIPASLNIVLERMKEIGDIMTLAEWRDRHSGWLGWGISKTKGWMFGSSSDSEMFLHLPTVRKLSQDFLDVYNQEFRSEVECTGEVVTYDEMLKRTRDLIATTETFDIILEHLTDTGDLTVGTTKTGEKVLKFKDHGSADPLKFTEADSSVVDIRKAMTKLDREIQQLEQKVKKYDEQCRACLRSGDKGRAQNFLRQRKRAEKDVADKDVQYQKLLTILHQISAAKNNKDVLKAYQSGAAAFKATLARQGLSPDKVHETMDDVANSIDEYKEIEEAISSPFISSSAVSDTELEQELDELISESKKDESIQLPNAPTNRFGLFDREVTPEEDQLEKRLALLRQAV